MRYTKDILKSKIYVEHTCYLIDCSNICYEILPLSPRVYHESPKSNRNNLISLNNGKHRDFGREMRGFFLLLFEAIFHDGLFVFVDNDSRSYLVAAVNN